MGVSPVHQFHQTGETPVLLWRRPFDSVLTKHWGAARSSGPKLALRLQTLTPWLELSVVPPPERAEARRLHLQLPRPLLGSRFGRGSSSALASNIAAVMPSRGALEVFLWILRALDGRGRAEGCTGSPEPKRITEPGNQVAGISDTDSRQAQHERRGSFDSADNPAMPRNIKAGTVRRRSRLIPCGGGRITRPSNRRVRVAVRQTHRT